MSVNSYSTHTTIMLNHLETKHTIRVPNCKFALGRTTSHLLCANPCKVVLSKTAQLTIWSINSCKGTSSLESTRLNACKVHTSVSPDSMHVAMLLWFQTHARFGAWITCISCDICPCLHLTDWTFCSMMLHIMSHVATHTMHAAAVLADWSCQPCSPSSAHGMFKQRVYNREHTCVKYMKCLKHVFKWASSPRLQMLRKCVW